MAASAHAPVIALDHVAVVRDGRPLLADITWTVQPGERWVVLGANGSGKSLLLRLASTYLLPTRGRAWVLGRRVGGTDLRDLRTGIGYVSATLARDVADAATALDVVLTGKDATLRRWRQEFTPAEHGRALGLLRDVGCGSLAHVGFARLSEGERQRIQLARSLMGEPRLVLLDEPSAGLDLPGRELLIAALSRLADDAAVAGVVFVTHHVEEIPPRFTHAILLREGRIMAAGPIDDLVTDEALSTCFGVAVSVQRIGERYAAVAARSAHVSGPL
ncbi:MAG: ATP-binding cassette domain-containing protein [Actinomycetota bacterium]|nr:ATP-binding cassette domain-containing protein [Actinomycetota bacterium]